MGLWNIDVSFRIVGKSAAPEVHGSTSAVECEEDSASST